MEVKMSTRLLHSWPTLQADLAKLASFSTETLGGNTGNLGRSNCWGSWTLLSSLLYRKMGCSVVVIGNAFAEKY